jgi:hypothetical protein
MIYAEAAYFQDYHFQHIADFYDHRRIQRLTAQAQSVIRRARGAGRPQGRD